MSFLSKPLGDLATWVTQHHKKRVYAFNEGSGADELILGNKGVSLCEMTRLGLPVPPGFVISTEASLEYYDGKFSFPDNFVSEYTKAIQELERKTGKVFGGVDAVPLLLSVRAGTSVSVRAHESKHKVPTRHTHFSLPESWCVP
eukprot:gene42766-56848_t